MAKLPYRLQIKASWKLSIEKISNALPVKSFWTGSDCCEDRDLTFHVAARHDAFPNSETD
jgi:hypothetical protein